MHYEDLFVLVFVQTIKVFLVPSTTTESSQNEVRIAAPSMQLIQ